MTGVSTIMAETKHKMQQERYVSSEEGVESKIEVTFGRARNVPGYRAALKLFEWVLWALLFAGQLWRAFSTGSLASLKRTVMIVALGMLLFFAMYRNAQSRLDTVRAKEEERASCHVCLDTAKIPGPPCSLASIADFTTHASQQRAFTALMNDHVSRDADHDCIVSFHIGSPVCAVTVRTLFGISTFYNPLESTAIWSTPPKQYEEDSDFFPGIVLKRQRPDGVEITYTTYDEKLGMLVDTNTRHFSGTLAVCVLHGLEVLNGTHHTLYGPKK
jgi:hypothetical protein